MSWGDTVPFVTRYARNAMVCTIDHLASGAGIAAIRGGGNAVDAAIAASAVLAVTSQHMCGMGGDLWALVHVPGEKRPYALNASGRSGSGADLDQLRRDGFTEMPFRNDPRSIPVPGCVDGWCSLHSKFGQLPFEQVLHDALRLAEDGFPISPECAQATQILAGVDNVQDYFQNGPPKAGSIIHRPGIARVLQEIATGGRDAFYGGDFGDELLTFGGGEYTKQDLANPQSDWVDPISIDAFGHRIWSLPPNSQGYLCLSAAWIADQLDLPADPADPLFVHLLAEAALQAGYDRPEVLHENANGNDLLKEERLAPRASRIRRNQVSKVPTGINPGDTIYLNAVDGQRMGVSLIQSNASGWGALAFMPKTGISLHNRGIGFSTDSNYQSAYGPGRRPPHTLAPTLVENFDGTLRAAVGTMGGDSQPQIVLQLLARLLAVEQSPAEALSAPRWRFAGSNPTGFHTWADPGEIVLELEGSAASMETPLTGLGHVVRSMPPHNSAFGHAHIIEVQDGGLAGAAEPRALTGGTAGY
ncbi:MAG: gamma-glutamyltranspeptidase [Actinobacteria bacterium]|nr:gamma-glutamyltranspeptidase [Actinomycetota bacterium]